MITAQLGRGDIVPLKSNDVNLKPTFLKTGRKIRN